MYFIAITLLFHSFVNVGFHATKRRWIIVFCIFQFFVAFLLNFEFVFFFLFFLKALIDADFNKSPLIIIHPNIENNCMLMPLQST